MSYYAKRKPVWLNGTNACIPEHLITNLDLFETGTDSAGMKV